jgi:hypothetical protein
MSRNEGKELKRMNKQVDKELKNEMCPVKWIENISEKSNIYFTRGNEVGEWKNIEPIVNSHKLSEEKWLRDKKLLMILIELMDTEG